MKAAIITVGTELLLGDILNTNTKYLSSLLTGLGIEVFRQESIGDYEKPIKEAIERNLKDCDILILSGGLGPTEDDRTKEYLSEVLHRPLIKNEEEFKKMIDLFERKNYILTDNNIKQIYTIEGSEVLHNHWGTAPGEYIREKGVHIFLLPGPPGELEPMASMYLPERIFDHHEIYEKSIQIMGLGESAVEARLRTLPFYSGLEINTFAHLGSVEVKIFGRFQENDERGPKGFNEAIQTVRDEFGPLIYSEEGNKMEEEIIQRFSRKNLKLSFAESITGGLLAKRITTYPHASNILKASYVTYSNESKHGILNVPESILNRYGAVSRETAEAMAVGLFQKGYCDIAVATTGEAGPEPAEKPVGTVFTAFYDGNKCKVRELNLEGNRREIQRRVVNSVFTELLRNY